MGILRLTRQQGQISRWRSWYGSLLTVPKAISNFTVHPNWETSHLLHAEEHGKGRGSREDQTMAAMTPSFPISISAPGACTRQARSHRRRRINPQAAQALTIVEDAIEHLTSEFVHECGPLAAHNAQLEAIQLLMAIDRRIYFECPEIPTVRDRCVKALHTLLHM